MDKQLYSRNQAMLQQLLRELRSEAGLRQQQVADELDEPQSFISKYESGERRLDILELREICQVLGISLEEFSRMLEKRIAGK